MQGPQVRTHWSLQDQGSSWHSPGHSWPCEDKQLVHDCHKPSGQLLPLDFGQGVVLKGQAWLWSARSPIGPCSSLAEVEDHWVSSGCWRAQLGRWPGSS